MNNEIKIFEHEQFGSVRTYEENGKVFFCGTDVANALGYAKPYNAVSTHCRYTLKRGIPHPQSPNKTIEVAFIPEGDLYRLITHSKLPSAESFECWVFDEVLPSIRKYGMYATEQTIDNVLNGTEEAEKLFIQLKEEKLRVKQLQKECDSLERLMAVTREANELLSATNELLEKRVEVLEPKASYYDSVLDSEELIPISLIAEDYGLTAQKLNGLLHGFGIQHPVGKSWAINREYLDMGYTQTKVLKYGTETITVTYWTQKGKKFIYEFLKELGIVPLNERKTA